MSRDWLILWAGCVGMVWEGAERHQLSQIEVTRADVLADLLPLECQEWESIEIHQIESEVALLLVWPATDDDDDVNDCCWDEMVASWFAPPEDNLSFQQCWR